MIVEILGKIFGTDKAIASVIDNTSKAIDALVYTDQEEVHDRAAATTEARSMLINWIDSSKGQNIARRALAFLIAGIWATVYLAIIGLSVSAVWSDDPDKLIRSATVLKESGADAKDFMTLVIGFYFAAPYLGGVVKGVLCRLSKK